MLVDILHLVREAERQGFDAAVIGCFYDVGLQAAREVAERMAVVAPCEAATRIAATLGDRFSIIVGRRKWIPEMMENVLRYGMKEHLASFKPIDMACSTFTTTRPRPPGACARRGARPSSRTARRC